MYFRNSYGIHQGGHATILYKYWKTKVSPSSKPRVLKSYELWLYATRNRGFAPFAAGWDVVGCWWIHIIAPGFLKDAHCFSRPAIMQTSRRKDFVGTSKPARRVLDGAYYIEEGNGRRKCPSLFQKDHAAHRKYVHGLR